MASTSKDKQPLPLADTLRDLALLRASDIDLSSLVPDNNGGASSADTNAKSVSRSYEFVKEARAALRVQSKGDLDRQGERVEQVREGLGEIVKGLDS